MSHRPWTGELKAVRNHAPGCPWLLVDGDDRVRAESNSKEFLDALALLVNRGGMLNDLLAIIHRDGGDYTAEHGVEKSLADAHEKWGRLVNKGGMAEELAKALRKLRDVEAPVCTCWRVPEDGPGWCSHCHASEALAAYDALGKEAKP